MGKRFSRDVLEKILSYITEDEERKVILESDDPVYWAENHFYDPDGGEVPFHAKEMFYDFMRTGGKDRAGRIGRQAGKCESADTRIQMADGSCPTAAEIYSLVGENGCFEIISTDMSTLKHVKSTAVITDNGFKPVLKVSTRMGLVTKNTDNHPYFVKRYPDAEPEWIEAKDLEVGYRVATTCNLGICSISDEESELTEEEAASLAIDLALSGKIFPMSIFRSSNNAIKEFLSTYLWKKRIDPGTSEWYGFSNKLSNICPENVSLLITLLIRIGFISCVKNRDGIVDLSVGCSIMFESNVLWQSISSIEICEREQTYAICVPETNNLITDNFITHNTVHTTVDIMHTASFSNNAIIDVFVPEKKNMNRMLEIMANLLRCSDLKSAFQMGAPTRGRDNKDVTPAFDYEIKVVTGSVIRFFFMSHKPDKARGQRATHIYVDEADYLPEKAFDVINGIVKGNLGIRVTAISTPSGIDGSWFRKFCDSCSKNNAEFHISTKQEKNWPEIEARLRMLIFDEVTWNLEVLAEWADAKGAVYKKDCIDEAVNRSILDGVRLTKNEVYETDEYKNATKWLGVDWNVPQNGVRLVEIAQMYGRLWVTRNYKISYENYTQTKSVEEILRLHSIYNYAYISVDQGYGEMQIEMLMKNLSIGGEDPMKVLNVVDSQKKEDMTIEFENPDGGRRRTVLSTRVKTKMINILGKAIESEMVFFKEDDDRDDGLVKEVRNFRRKAAAMDGGFIYSENTHSLSALQINMHGVDKWRRMNGMQSQICTEVISTESLEATLRKKRVAEIAIASSPIFIGTSSRQFIRRTEGLSNGKSKRSIL